MFWRNKKKKRDAQERVYKILRSFLEKEKERRKSQDIASGISVPGR